MESRKLLANASLFRLHRHAQEQDPGDIRHTVPEGENTRHAPFHSYTMKQAIQERFIIDVLKDYTR